MSLIQLALVLSRLAAAEPAIVADYSLGGPAHALVQPQAAAFDAARGELWVSGQDETAGRLVVIDAAQGKPVASIPGPLAGALAFDPTLDRVYATAYGQLRVIDAASRVVQSTITLGGCMPRAVAVDAATSDLVLLCDVWDAALKRTRQELARRSKTGAPLAQYAFPSDAMFSAAGDSLRLRGGRVHLALQRTEAATNARRGELWVFEAATLAPSQTLSLGAEASPAGCAFDEPAGTLLVAETSGRIRGFGPGADGPGLVVVSTFPNVGPTWNVALDPAQRRLYALDYFGHRVGVVSVAARTLEKTIPVGKNPWAAALDPAGRRLWVLNRLSNDLTALSLDALSVAATVDIRLRGAFDLALDPTTQRAFVTSGLPGGGFQAFDRVTGQAGEFTQWNYDTPGSAAYLPSLDKLLYLNPGYARRFSLATGTSVTPNALSLATGLTRLEGSTRLLVTLYRSQVAPVDRSMLALFDAQSESVVRQVAIAASSATAKAAAYSLALDKAYVPLWATGELAVVDVGQGVLLKTVAVGVQPSAAAVDDRLSKVFVANSGSNTVSVLDSRTESPLAVLSVGRRPQALAIKRRGGRVYVANASDKTLTVLSGATHETVAVLPLGGTPQAVRVDDGADRVYVTLREGGRIVVIADPHSGDSEPPVVSHSPVAGPVPESQAAWVRATVTDDRGVASVALTYWDPAGGGRETVPMKPVSGSLYEAPIPASFLASLRGTEVSYFIDASDAEGNGPPSGAAPGTAASPNRFQVQKLLVKAWNYEFGEVFGGFYRMIPGPSAAIGELRADAAGLEVATGNEEYYPLGSGPGDPMGRWFLFDAAGRALFWKDTENDEAHSSVLLYDLDGDGTPEMLGGTTSGNQLQAFTSTGAWRWRYYLGMHHVATPAAAVLQPGEAATVFSGAMDSYFRALDARTGRLKWSFEAADWIWSSPAVADLDGDGEKEVAFGSDGGMFYLLDASTPVVRWERELGGAQDHIRASAALADVDGDGKLEALIGAPTGVFHCLDGKTGAARWTFQTGGEILSSAAVGDLDGDSKPEIVFGSADGYLYALRGDGSLRWRVQTGAAVYSSPALARRNPGAGLDVYVTTLGGALLIVRGADGSILGGFQVGAEVVSSPVAADVDGDGRLEVFFQDRKGDVDETMRGDFFWAVRDLGSNVPPFAREWPMFRSDAAHTGVYGAAPSPPAAPPPEPTPQAPSGFAGTPLGPTSIRWSWTDNATDEGGYRVLSGTTNVSGDLPAGSASWTQTGLSPNAAHGPYRVQAFHAAGSADSSATVSTWTLAAIPAGLAVTAVSTATVSFSWSANANPSSTLYEVLRSTGGPAVVAGAVTALAFTDSGLASGASYLYQVRAVNGSGIRTEPTAPVTAKTELPLPAKVTGLAVEAPAAGGVLRVSWTANVESGATGYRVYRGETLLASATALSFLDTGLVDGTTYAYRVSALSSGAQEGPKSDPASGVPADRLPPGSRITIPASGAVLTIASLAVSGTAADAGVAGVGKVEFGWRELSSPATTWAQAAGTAAWTAQASGLADGKSYFLFSRAADREGNVEAHWPSVQIRVDLPPAKPAGLELSAPAEGGTLRLTWKAAAEPDVAGYRAYRDGKLLASTTALALLDAGLTDGATYSYRVAALDLDAREGPLSLPIAGTPRDSLSPESALSAPADGARLSAAEVAVLGTALDRGVAGLQRVEVGLAAGDGAFAWAPASATASFSAAVAGLADGKSYRVASRAIDREGNVEASPAWVTVTVDLPPGPVSGLHAEPSAPTGSAKLSWEAPPASDLAGYRVYGPDGALAGTPAEPAFLMKGLELATTVACRVSAVDKAGQEGPKTAVSVFLPEPTGAARAWIRVPTEGKKLWGNAVTLMADTEGPVAKVLFQFRHDNELAWTDVTSADSKPPYSVYWNISDARVSTGPYRLRAAAWDEAGLPDPTPIESRVVLDDANADLVEDGNPEVDPNQAHRKEQKLTGKETEEVSLGDGTKVVIPPGAVPEGETLRLKVVPPEEAPKPVARDSALEPVGVFREFTFVSGTREFNKDLILTLPVPDDDKDGYVDGTRTRVSDLRVYYYSEKDRVWLPVESKGKQAVAAGGAGGAAGATFTTRHFTLFGLFEEKAVSQAPGLGEVYAFPNPATAGKNPTFHVDSGPAERMELRVYDVSGQLVYSTRVDAPPNVIDGRYAYRHTWEASRAASGLYLYVVDVYGAGGAKSTKSAKLALVR